MSEPSFVPLAGKTVSHEIALLDVVHDTFDVTSIAVFPADADGFHVVADKVSTGDGVGVGVGTAPEDTCVTVTVRSSPPPLTVSVPVRLAELGFAREIIENWPLPVPVLT